MGKEGKRVRTIARGTAKRFPVPPGGQCSEKSEKFPLISLAGPAERAREKKQKKKEKFYRGFSPRGKTSRLRFHFAQATAISFAVSI